MGISVVLKCTVQFHGMISRFLKADPVMFFGVFNKYANLFFASTNFQVIFKSENSGIIHVTELPSR